MTTKTNTAPTIADLNDRFRRSRTGEGIPGQKVATRGIVALPPALQLVILATVATFDAFTEDNDPWGEHDFGSFEVDGAGRIFWKIDYYADSKCEAGSEAPQDVDRSFRVLTVMLASEY